jgi:hypothetical protein
MHALAAVLHGASVDCCGLGFGEVVGLGVVFVVVVVLDVVVLGAGGVVLLVVDVVAGAVTVVVEAEVVDVEVMVCWPAARPTAGDGDEQALSTAVAAAATPMISFRTRIMSPSACDDPFVTRTTCYSRGLRSGGYQGDLGSVT